MRATTDGRPPAPGLEKAGAPQPIDPATGQHGAYWILSEAERAKGFIRPVRASYRHVGRRPRFPLRELTAQEAEQYRSQGFVKYEAFLDDSLSPAVGRYWTAEDLRGGCGTVTTMGQALAETYARDPEFYGATFCCGCRRHLPVEEFVWDGTDETVGS